MQKSLVAFDTDHIKRYVFATDRLKEVRGASSLLDYLNRVVMPGIAARTSINATCIYVNGGSGLFIVDTAHADTFGKLVQEEYREQSHGGASITYVVQDLPKGTLEDIAELQEHDLADSLELLRLKLREKKGHPPATVALPSHPFFRPCDACGIEYAQEKFVDDNQPAEPLYYCASCKEKQAEDERVRLAITKIVENIREDKQSSEQLIEDGRLWPRILGWLSRVGYDFGVGNVPVRPNDFNIFREFTESKDYIGLIYADANNMGKETEKFTRLTEHKQFAGEVDNAIHLAMARAIKEHLPLVSSSQKGTVLFPFDILLLGGDDIVLVTDAAKAMDVALTIAQQFREITENKYTLSIGVVLFPVKYPFGLVQDLAESTLKFAKKDSANVRKTFDENEKGDDSRINFMVVTGGVLQSFEAIWNKEYFKTFGEGPGRHEFKATLRSYAPEDLAHLLTAIRKGKDLHLGRSKLHQLREAILKMNVTTSVSEGLAVLRNWKTQQRSHVLKQVYNFRELYPLPLSDPNDPTEGFPSVIFPWFIEGEQDEQVYSTVLLDFVELYDFVGRKEEQL